MDSQDLRQLLDGVRHGRVSPEQAAQTIRTAPYVEAGGFAKVDLHRRLRCGAPEVVFGQGKSAEQVEAILRVLVGDGAGGLVTRIDPATAEHLQRAWPRGEWNALGRTFRVRATRDPGPT